jgi:hypothetical protein
MTIHFMQRGHYLPRLKYILIVLCIFQVICILAASKAAVVDFPRFLWMITTPWLGPFGRVDGEYGLRQLPDSLIDRLSFAAYLTASILFIATLFLKDTRTTRLLAALGIFLWLALGFGVVYYGV